MRAVEFVVRGPLVRGDVPGLCGRLAAAVRRVGADAVTVDLAALTAAPSPAAVEAVARMRLTAGRLGCRLTFRHVAGDLRDLLVVLGLGDVLDAA
ncbi:STAS domain-containing protein [Streptomyces sp. RFCAC02]|uniref:STAS domain-containing protein n=1 Tax=Streptomyces sp. RFCAC02 TaxID=2499143 RepID=UPI00143DD29B|nr:STAS domain-containing protein [Streptomyces sp. RFCAC02]